MASNWRNSEKSQVSTSDTRTGFEPGTSKVRMTDYRWNALYGYRHRELVRTITRLVTEICECLQASTTSHIVILHETPQGDMIHGHERNYRAGITARPCDFISPGVTYEGANALSQDNTSDLTRQSSILAKLILSPELHLR